MPPADGNMPDFDSMSPEEVMQWMESLAKRQGASEGFTTAADMEIAEVDPDSVDQSQITEYVPFGWTEEKWKARLAEEEAQKAAKAAAAPPPAPKAAPPPPEPVAAPPPAVSEAPAVSQAPAAMSADGTPDFDSMSPEEVMQWMESLAKRQGASEGFTTSADMQIAEVDPDSVDQSQITEYVPFGWTEEKWKARLAEEEAQKAAKAAAPPPPAPKATPPPVAAAPPPEPEPVMEMPDIPMLDEDEQPTEPTPAADMSWLESLSEQTGGAMPEMDLSSLDTDLGQLEIEGLGGDSQTDPMDWLENLAQGQQETAFDLPDFEAEADEEEAAIASSPVSSPMDTGDDPVEWLESLAKRQGVDDEELTTSGGLDVPMPNFLDDDGPGYEEYAIESEADEALEMAMPNLDFDSDDDDFDLSNLDDPEEWLESIATGSVPSAPADDETSSRNIEDVMSALNAGQDVAAEDIANMFNAAFDVANRRTDVEDYIDVDDDDDETPAVPTEIPDWLRDQVGMPPGMGLETEPAAADDDKLAALEDAMAEAEPVAEIPDWLQESASDDDDTIFAEEDDEDAIAALAQAAPASIVEDTPLEEVDSIEEVVEVDQNDPWVRAFKIEHEEQDALEEWYQENVNAAEAGAPVSAPKIAASPPAAPKAPAVPQAPAAASGAPLAAANLPDEERLEPGEPESMPDWLDVTEAEAPQSAVFDASAPMPQLDMDADFAGAGADEEMPDWLRDSTSDDIAVVGTDADAGEGLPDWLSNIDIEPEEIPDWLRDTISTGEQATVADESTITAPPPAQAPRPAAAKSISPAPMPAINIDVAATLESARNSAKAGAINDSLLEYESIIRANAELPTVSLDLERLLREEAHAKNPAIYRVMGDSLMRQGKLAEALQTYQRALNLL